jgi:hypothetical protein
MYIGLHVKCRLLLADFNETCNVSADFRKNTQIPNFIKIRPVGTEMFHTDGRTDMMELIVTLHKYANAPKNSALRHQLTLEASAVCTENMKKSCTESKHHIITTVGTGGTGGMVNL